MKYFFFLILIFNFLCAHEDESNWAKDTLSKMTLKEKVGQLFIAPVCPLREDEHVKDILRLIEDYHLGGVIVKQADPITQMQMVALLQDKANIPLFITQDAENGLGMRMQNTIAFPKNLTLGAIRDDSYMYLLGKEIGKQMRLIGSHINFAPVVDVNTNPLNPIIHMRSFGDDVEKVAAKAMQFVKGLQEEGILACAKHFPGHGDTICDSHHDLPLIPHSKTRLENIELYPFKVMIENDVDCVMVAHLHIPSLVGNEIIPSSLSSKVVEKILRKDLNFEGLIISDALNMKALRLYFSVEDIAYLAYISGHDILLYGDHIHDEVDYILQNDIPRAMEALIRGFEEKRLKIQDLDERVLRILEVKERLSLCEKQNPFHMDEILKQLHSEYAKELKKKLYELAITVVDENTIFPLKDSKKIAYLSLGDIEQDLFYETLSENVDLIPVTIDDLDSAEEKDIAATVISFYQINPHKENYGIDLELLKEMEKLNEQKTIFILFGTPYAMSLFEKEHTILLAYEEDMDAQIAAANILLGNMKAKGHLPVSVLKKQTFSPVR